MNDNLFIILCSAVGGVATIVLYVILNRREQRLTSRMLTAHRSHTGRGKFHWENHKAGTLMIWQS